MTEGAGVRRYMVECTGVLGAIRAMDELLGVELCAMDGIGVTMGEGLLLLASIWRATVMKHEKKCASVNWGGCITLGYNCHGTLSRGQMGNDDVNWCVTQG